ncbi:MAG TPA: hypothetical protein VGN20_11310 [Mucilaginibacter sp.]|jgi:hypothetical protein
MGTKTRKIELRKTIPGINEENWWDELPVHVKLGVGESLEQADQGDFVSYDDVKKEVNAVLCIKIGQ